MCSEFIQEVVSDLSRRWSSLAKCALYKLWCFDIYTHTPADPGPGAPFSILEVMRVARLISLEFSRNLSMTLPSDYTPLTIAEVFYMATMGGAQGTYQTTRVHEPSQVVCIIIRIVHILLVNCYCTCCNLNKWRNGSVLSVSNSHLLSYFYCMGL